MVETAVRHTGHRVARPDLLRLARCCIDGDGAPICARGQVVIPVCTRLGLCLPDTCRTLSTGPPPPAAADCGNPAA